MDKYFDILPVFSSIAPEDFLLYQMQKFILTITSSFDQQVNISIPNPTPLFQTLFIEIQRIMGKNKNENGKDKENEKEDAVGSGLALGMSLGLLIWHMVNNIALGVALGPALGMAFGAAFGKK